MRKALTPMGETEMEILQLVWERGESTVADIQEEIMKQRKVAYTTVMTIMKNLADKGYLTYRKEGLTYIYSPKKAAEDVKSSLLEAILDKVFKGSPTDLVQTLVKREELSENERKEIIDLIKKMK